MNALQRLIQEWIDAAPERNPRVLARRAGMKNANTIYAIMRRNDPASVPRRDTLEALARGLGKPYQEVAQAAAEAGLRVEAMDPDDPQYRAWVSLLADLSDEDRARLWDVGTAFLRHAKD